MSDCGIRFEEHSVRRLGFSGFAGLKNGALLLAAERAGFDVLVTVDQSIPDQQNVHHYRISLLILCGRTNRLADLKPLVPAALHALRSIGPGQVLVIGRSIK